MKIVLTILLIVFFQINAFSQPVKDSSKRVVFRCSASISYPSKTLIVIDGMANDSIDINTINPASIKSVTVMKGPAATALYGIKAREGVILITTKCEVRLPAI
ncbi:MAG: hypothetical protein EOO04_38180 [Chitinophagaceae bacterium]|nr:MAG: hypothetical protein EOO04_38180 [Chitinophagaceae bacterium]